MSRNTPRYFPFTNIRTRPCFVVAYSVCGSDGVEAIDVKASEPATKGRTASWCWVPAFGDRSAREATMPAIISSSRTSDPSACWDSRYFFSRIWRSSSSLPGCRMASTWSPGLSSVYPTAISALPSRITEMRRAPSGSRSFSTVVPAHGRRLVDLHLDDLQVLLAQLEQVHEVVLGHLVLDEAEDAGRRAHGGRDAEQVEVRLVARIVDARDHLRHAVLLLGDLGDHEVVLVVAGQGEHEIGRPLDARLLEDEELGRVALHRLVLELGLEPLVAVAILLDDRRLVAVAQQVRMTLAPALPPPAISTYI